MAAAPRFDEADRQVTLAAKNGPSRLQSFERDSPVLSIELFQSAMLRVIDDSRPQCLRFTAHHDLGMLRDLVWPQRRMEAAHYDWHATLSIFRRNLIRPFRGVGLDAHCDEIGRLLERNAFHPI